MTGIALPSAWERVGTRATDLGRWAPPFGRREFWIVQALTIGIALGHALNEWTPMVDLQGADFLPVSLYLVPVVYAGLTFGTRGAVPTAIWAFILTVPNAMVWHAGTGTLGELWQAGLVLGVGLFVGNRVDRESAARRESELRERERRASDARYRGVFEVAADAILVLDGEHRIIDANTAARELLSKGDELRGSSLDALCPAIADAVCTADPVPCSPDAASRSARGGPYPIDLASGRMWVEPVSVPFQDASGQTRVLTQLRNVTPAIERQRLLEEYARRANAAREEERRRVARDLHDGPLQSLVLLWRTLDAAAEEASDGAAGPILLEARHQTEDVADELRRFSRDLRPSILDDLGLAAALKAEVVAFTSRTGVNGWFESKGAQGRLPMEIELTLLRICQEALRNVERHARATHLRVMLRRRENRYRMTIADDGVGIATLPSAPELVSAGCLGIVGMQERARLVGASCRVHRSAAWSTEVDVVGSVDDSATPRRQAVTSQEEQAAV